MFTQKVINECVSVAKKLLVEPAALLAVVEVESRGKAFEHDKRTPIFLFERHKFHEYLRKQAPQKLDRAVQAGLAIPTWSRTTQYKDLGNSRSRMHVLARAIQIDEECAYLACSWGVGQVMGFNCRSLGFKSAVEMVNFMIRGGIAAQVEVMFRFIQRNKLIDEINAHDWARFAHSYNGAGYRANQYDTKMASAYAKWSRALDLNTPENGTEEETEIDMPDVVQRPDAPEPPATDILKSKTVWATIGSALMSLLTALSNPYVQVVLLIIIAAFAGFIIYERRKKQKELLV